MSLFARRSHPPRKQEAGRAAWTGGGGASRHCVTIRVVSPLETLVSRLPEGRVSTDAEILRERAADSWALALLRRVRGDHLPEPAAAVFPADTGEVATVLAWASQTATPVISRGGGSGVCGGAQAQAGDIILDLSPVDRVGEGDAGSPTLPVPAGGGCDPPGGARARRALSTRQPPQDD